ncbi:MAG: paeninodin family lasso peptide [Rhodobacteraceae bacterium]|nr:MAG: paeninodin family lasso peptide [Paracoccaceae bacterium]
MDVLEPTMTNQKETWNSPVLETLDVTRTMSGNFTLASEGFKTGLFFGTEEVVGLGMTS